MGHLWAIAQAHLDAYGVRAAALARRMGTSPQTLDSWKNRGVRQLPERRLLEALARETGTPYGDVLMAALRDINYLPPREGEGRADGPASTNGAGDPPAEKKRVRSDRARSRRSAPRTGSTPPPPGGDRAGGLPG